MKAKIIEVLKDFRALKPLEQVNQLEYYAEVIHSLYDLPTEEEIEDIIWNCVGRQTPMSRHESQIAAFGEEQSDPEENHDEAWLQNRNHGG